MATNYEKRKNMTLDEMVEDLHNIDLARSSSQQKIK